MQNYEPHGDWRRHDAHTTIVLPESEWQALRTAEPDAIGWLQAQIRQRLGDERAPKRDDESAFDEY